MTTRSFTVLLSCAVLSGIGIALYWSAIANFLLVHFQGSAVGQVDKHQSIKSALFAGQALFFGLLLIAALKPLRFPTWLKAMAVGLTAVWMLYMLAHLVVAGLLG